MDGFVYEEFVTLVQQEGEWHARFRYNSYGPPLPELSYLNKNPLTYSREHMAAKRITLENQRHEKILGKGTGLEQLDKEMGEVKKALAAFDLKLGPMRQPFQQDNPPLAPAP